MHKNFLKWFVIFILSFFIFVFLEFESSIFNIPTLIQPIIFAMTMSISICIPTFRKNLLLISFCFLIIMILIYLFNYANEANLIGSLGFGMLVITIASYIPELVKRGHIEKY